MQPESPLCRERHAFLWEAADVTTEGDGEQETGEEIGAAVAPVGTGELLWEGSD
jgi:hypothetical protein